MINLNSPKEKEKNKLNQQALRIFFLLIMLSLLPRAGNGQLKSDKHVYNLKQCAEETGAGFRLLQDTTKPKSKSKKFSLSGFFLSIGGGLSVPVAGFNRNSDVAFGFLGRIEFSSTSIFPLIIGGEFNYFSYPGADQFKTLNVIDVYKTRILSYGLTVEYTLSKLLYSSYTIPFLTLDVKNNMIKREYDNGANLEELPREETKFSVGAGAGFTLFVFDFLVKYNYMKSLSNIGVYTKIKIPIIRF